MPLEPYSLCPGGRGKKIKFCCSDLVSALQKIERMTDGNQHVACLDYIEHLEPKHPHRACLLAAKTMLLRLVGRAEEAAATAAAFLEKHPDNPVALAESAMTAVVKDGPAGMALLMRAIAACGDYLHARVYEAAAVVARVLALEGHLLAARALSLLQLFIRPEERLAMDLLMQLNGAPSVPLVIKEDRPLDRAPEDAPFKSDFEKALALANHARWLEAAERFEALTGRAADWPAVWWNLALIRGWLADAPGSIEALRKYASLDVPLEDAVEAETLALCLSEDPLGDKLDVLLRRYPVKDAAAIQGALSAAARAARIEVDPASLAEEGGPAPAAVFAVFNRPAAAGGESASLESIPRVLCQALVFGRETDRGPRLEVVGLVSPDREEVDSLLAEVTGDQLDGEPTEEVVDGVSATREMLSRNCRLPAEMSRKDFRKLTARYVADALLEKWPDSPLGLLDGKSPRQAAADGEASRVKLLAAVMLIESWLEIAAVSFDANRLRSRLGLPELGPIDPQKTSLDRLPLVRLARVEVDKLSDDALRTVYRRAAAFGARAALKRFAEALVRRPLVADGEEQFQAYVLLIRTADDPGRALALIEQGRRALETAGTPCASWDLLELPVHFDCRDGAEVSRLVHHIQSRHLNEPGVAEALTELLVDVGVIRPDGTPANAPAEEGPPIVVPDQTGTAPGELWTPDSQKPGGEKPKIWTPGME